MSTLKLFFQNILTEISCREAIKFPSENSYKKNLNLLDVYKDAVKMH